MSISAGKYWTAAVTTTGDVYMWDGKKYKDDTPVATRLHGVKRATSVCIGETHLLVLCALYHSICSSEVQASQQKPLCEKNVELEELDEEFLFNDNQTDSRITAVQNDDVCSKAAPSLKSLCEKLASELLVEPKNVIQLMEIADSLEADELRKHCEVLQNSIIVLFCES